MESNGNEYSLVINQVVQQEEGQYTVRATNSEGTTQAVATLTVKGIEN
jgi:Immunoglobulin I-set domain